MTTAKTKGRQRPQKLVPVLLVSDRAWEHLETLRRVPDDVILAAGSRDFEMGDGTTCVCGWVVREALARLPEHKHETADQLNEMGYPFRCVTLFGGTEEEWQKIYDGVTYGPTLEHVELAFALRMDEALGARLEIYDG